MTPYRNIAAAAAAVEDDNVHHQDSQVPPKRRKPRARRARPKVELDPNKVVWGLLAIHGERMPRRFPKVPDRFKYDKSPDVEKHCNPPINPVTGAHLELGCRKTYLSQSAPERREEWEPGHVLVEAWAKNRMARGVEDAQFIFWACLPYGDAEKLRDEMKAESITRQRAAMEATRAKFRRGDVKQEDLRVPSMMGMTPRSPTPQHPTTSGEESGGERFSDNHSENLSEGESGSDSDTLFVSPQSPASRDGQGYSGRPASTKPDQSLGKPRHTSSQYEAAARKVEEGRQEVEDGLEWDF